MRQLYREGFLSESDLTERLDSVARSDRAISSQVGPERNPLDGSWMTHLVA